MTNFSQSSHLFSHLVTLLLTITRIFLPLAGLLFSSMAAALNTTDANAPSSNSQAEKTLYLYHDADWSNYIESAQSIWRGVHTALSEVNYQIQGYKLVLIKKDHGGNVALSKKNMQDFMQDPQALAIISGIHSPPLIKHRTFINKNKLLTLVPWAAGASITRHPSSENWVFRLSIDDTKAGATLVNFALKNKQCKKPHLILENTPWGLSNLKSMTRALQDNNIKTVAHTFFKWGIKSYTARQILEDAVRNNADCVLLTANAIEGAEIVMALASMPKTKRIPIISHWGITGGDFHKKVHGKIRDTIDLSFIQSCFSFLQTPMTAKAQTVFSQAQNLFPEQIQSPFDIRSPAGFIHGYDITLLLLEALRSVQLSDNIQLNRQLTRKALEQIKGPVQGLIKPYKKPFDAFDRLSPDAHEALDSTDYCMAKYGNNDEIILLNAKTENE